MLIPTQWSICGLNWPADKKGLLKTHPTDAGDDFVKTWFPLTMCQPLTFLCSSRKPPYGLVVIELNDKESLLRMAQTILNRLFGPNKIDDNVDDEAGLFSDLDND